VRVAQLIVRNLDEETVRALKRRAARNGRSTEAEHREILRATLRRPRSAKSLKQLLLEMPAGGRDDDFVRPRERGRRVRL
jgi:antitoxin FitA